MFQHKLPASNYTDSFWTSEQNGSHIEVKSDSGALIMLTAITRGISGESSRSLEMSLSNYVGIVHGYQSRDKETSMAWAVFGYSGHRFLSTDSKFSLGHSSINPFEAAIDFEKTSDSNSSIANWAGNILAKQAFAEKDQNKKVSVKARETLDRFEEILREITGRVLKFNVDYEVLRVNMNLDGKEVEFSVLPDGLKSVLSWMADLIIRMESIRWEKKQSIFDQPIILFLDEIDIHLHPSWQKKILPIIQKTFVNAQIFVSTHSPFVVASVEDAYVYDLNIGKDGYAFLENVLHTEKGQTYSRVLKEIFDVDTEFADPWTEKKLDSFYELLKQAKSKKTKAYKDVFSVGKELAEASIELRDIVSVELNQLDRRIAAAK